MTDNDDALKSDDYRKLERGRRRTEEAEKEPTMSHIYPDPTPSPLETFKQFYDSGIPSAVTINDCKPPDRVADALESIAVSLEKMANPPIPASGSLEEVSQRLVNVLSRIMAWQPSAGTMRGNEWHFANEALSAAAALGIVPGGAK